MAMDVDGVLTDGLAFYGSDGFEGLSFDVQDGSGIKYLQRNGIEIALITGRSVPAVRERAETLGIEYLYQGAKVKLDAYKDLKNRTGFTDQQIGYAGDDLPDIPLLRTVGLAVAVANAREEIKQLADIVTTAPGGHGAIREIAEIILKSRGTWESVLNRYFEMT